MTLATRKYNFIQEIIAIDESLFDKLELFVKANKQDWFLELSDDEKQEIHTGIAQANNQEFTDNDVVMKKFSKWH